MARVLSLPLHDRPLPLPADLDLLLHARYVVLVVAGRSGSGLIHSHLDGHRQIAQIPAIWKFHDFLAAKQGILQASTASLAQAFVEFPAHAMLFDTRQSTMHTGTLGTDGALTILIDRDAFRRALVSALGDAPPHPRRLLYAAVLAYEWCLGRDTRAARAVLHHLHHGDWLWPDLLIDRFNLGGVAPVASLKAALAPDLLLVSTRAPLEILRSYPALTAAVTGSGEARVAYYEQLLHLLVQDWLRARVASGGGVPTLGVRLEDMKSDRDGTLAMLCAAMSVDASDPALGATTFFGQGWTEDSWSERRRAVVASQPETGLAIGWQDEAYVLGALAGLSDEIYPTDRDYADWNSVLALLLKAAEDPPATLFPELKTTAAGLSVASAAAWDRISYFEQFRALVSRQEIGPLRLCRRVQPDR